MIRHAMRGAVMLVLALCALLLPVGLHASGVPSEYSAVPNQVDQLHRGAVSLLPALAITSDINVLSVTVLQRACSGVQAFYVTDRAFERAGALGIAYTNRVNLSRRLSNRAKRVLKVTETRRPHQVPRFTAHSNGSMLDPVLVVERAAG